MILLYHKTKGMYILILKKFVKILQKNYNQSAGVLAVDGLSATILRIVSSLEETVL